MINDFWGKVNPQNCLSKYVTDIIPQKNIGPWTGEHCLDIILIYRMCTNIDVQSTRMDAHTLDHWITNHRCLVVVYGRRKYTCFAVAPNSILDIGKCVANAPCGLRVPFAPTLQFQPNPKRFILKRTYVNNVDVSIWRRWSSKRFLIGDFYRCLFFVCVVCLKEVPARIKLSVHEPL